MTHRQRRSSIQYTVVLCACSLLRLEFNSRLLDYYTELDAVRLVGRRPLAPDALPARLYSSPKPKPDPDADPDARVCADEVVDARVASVAPAESDQQPHANAESNPLASLASLAHRLASQLSLSDGNAGDAAAADSLASSNGFFDLLNVCSVRVPCSVRRTLSVHLTLVSAKFTLSLH